MQVWNVLHAARWKYRTQKWCKKSPSAHHRTTLSGYIFATEAHIDNRKKNLLSSNISTTCPYNTVNFGPLAAEIVSLVWGTPTNFNGFRVLAALLHSQTAALNRGRHLYSAGRPSRWALAHISSYNWCRQLVFGYKCYISPCSQPKTSQYHKTTCNDRETAWRSTNLTFLNLISCQNM